MSQPETVYGLAVAFLVLAAFVGVCLIHRHSRLGRWAIPGAILVMSLGCAGVLVQRLEGRNIQAGLPYLGWQEIGIEAVEIGPLEMVRTWNGRANPRVQSISLLHPEDVLERIDSLGIHWAVGSVWDRMDLPQGSRMFTHPPGLILFLANWFKIFGQTTYSALLFVLAVKCALLATVGIWTLRLIPAVRSLDRISVLLVFATAPPVLLHVFPANNEMATLLSLCGIMIAFTLSNLVAYIGGGALILFAAYTHFLYVYLGIFSVILFIPARSAWKRHLSLGLALGMGSTFGVFTWLGYYPWLTYLVGSAFETEYRAGIPYDTLTAFLEYSYLGTPLIILSVLSLVRLAGIRSRLERRWMMAVALSLAVAIYHVFGLTNGQRYLIGFFLLMTPILAKCTIDLKLRQSQAHAIPLAGLAFISLVIFF
jgi:hypothetical protein